MNSLVTSSQARAFRRCQRYHRYRYVDLIVPIVDDSVARDWGTVMHLALEVYHSTVAGGFDSEQCLKKISSSHLPAFAKVAAEVMMVAYATRWIGADSASPCTHVELEFTAPLINPDSLAASRLYQIGGKIDGIISDGSEALIVEHKTTSADISEGSDYWVKLRTDTQLSTYIDGAKASGIDVKGALYDVIKRPSLTPKPATPKESREYTKGKGCKLCGGKVGQAGQGTVSDVQCAPCAGSGWQPSEEPRMYKGQRDREETIEEYRARLVEQVSANPDAFFKRHKVVRLGKELIEHRRDMWRLVQSMHRSVKDDSDYRNPDACIAYGKVCEYYAVCSGSASIDDPQIFKRAQSAHAELTNAKEAK